MNNDLSLAVESLIQQSDLPKASATAALVNPWEMSSMIEIQGRQFERARNQHKILPETRRVRIHQSGDRNREG